MKALHCELQIFNYFIERIMEKIRARHEVHSCPSNRDFFINRTPPDQGR